MAFEFKKLSDVEVVVEPNESANVLIEENGIIKKAPKTAVGGAGNALGFDMIIQGTDTGYNLLHGDANNIRQRIMQGQSVIGLMAYNGYGIAGTGIIETIEIQSDFLLVNNTLCVFYDSNVVTERNDGPV